MTSDSASTAARKKPREAVTEEPALATPPSDAEAEQSPRDETPAAVDLTAPEY